MCPHHEGAGPRRPIIVVLTPFGSSTQPYLRSCMGPLRLLPPAAGGGPEVPAGGGGADAGRPRTGNKYSAAFVKETVAPWSRRGDVIMNKYSALVKER